MKKTDIQTDHEVAARLARWYEAFGRDLPWRHTRDAYRVWLSEVILQQTRVNQGLDYYLRFTQRFPTVADLAAASEDEVLKLWQGLGYYSRARNLHRAAREVVERFGGEFPRRYDEVRSLRGVGDYTAAAVCSISYDEPVAVVDGNVYRLLSRLYDEPSPIDSTAGKRLFRDLATAVMGGARPSTHNQAVMDFGAMVCTPRSPRCGECPLEDRCLARAHATVELRPVKTAKTAVRERWFNYLHITCEDRLPLLRRGEGDIWQGLYEFPMIETGEECTPERLVAMSEFREWVGGAFTLRGSVSLRPHRLTHRLIHAVVYRVEVAALTPRARAVAIPASSLEEYAIPRLLELYLEKN